MFEIGAQHIFAAGNRKTGNLWADRDATMGKMWDCGCDTHVAAQVEYCGNKTWRKQPSWLKPQATGGASANYNN